MEQKKEVNKMEDQGKRENPVQTHTEKPWESYMKENGIETFASSAGTNSEADIAGVETNDNDMLKAEIAGEEGRQLDLKTSAEASPVPSETTEPDNANHVSENVSGTASQTNDNDMLKAETAEPASASHVSEEATAPQAETNAAQRAAETQQTTNADTQDNAAQREGKATAGQMLDRGVERAKRYYEKVKEEGAPAYEQLKRDAGRLFEGQQGEKNHGTQGAQEGNMLQRMIQMARNYFTEPQRLMHSVAKGADRDVAWSYFGVMAVIAFITGLFSDGIGIGVSTAITTAIGALIYPALTCAVANMRRNRVSMSDVFAVFWVKGIPLYAINLVSAVFLLLGLWPLVLILTVFELVLGFVLNYMATLAICDNNSKEGLWTFSIVNLILVVLFIALVVLIAGMMFGLALSIVQSGDYGMLYSIMDEIL